MDPEWVCATAVRAGLVCHAYNSTHNTLTATARSRLIVYPSIISMDYYSKQRNDYYGQ